MSLLKDIAEVKKSQDEKDLVYYKRRLKELNKRESSIENDKLVADAKKRIKELEKKIPIDVEAKVIDESNDDKKWSAAELKAWQERFPKAKSKTVEEFRKEFPKYHFRRQDDVISLKLAFFGESSLIKELSVANRPSQTDLKKSDATDAGANDVADKAQAGADVSFSLMRNTINANGKVSGSDITDYIERAEELNDEVDTVPFGLETDDGQIVKVYVNAEQADKFEEAMKQMLGLEDDIEEAINRLTTEFDIVDVVWPRSEDEDGEADPDQDLSIDDTSNLKIDAEDDQDFADDNYDVVAATDNDETKQEKSDSEEDDDIAAAAAEDEDGDDTPDGGGSKKKSSSEDEEDEDSDEEELDDDGKPKKKKKKKAQPAEPVEDEPVKESKERVADSSSIAAAMKIMTSKGLHIKAMDEDEDGNVYIEDDNGDEYVMRNDKHLTKEKHSKKLTSLDKREKVQEKNMTIGSKFLSRVMLEAAGEDKDGVKDGFNIPLDSQARALVAKLKLPFAKRLIAFHVMSGVPGRYLNTEDVEGTIAGAADMLRKKVSVRRAFQALYDGLATAKGYAPPAEETVTEAAGEFGDKQWFKEKSDWAKACAKIDIEDDGSDSNGDWAKCDGKTVARWYEDRGEGWVREMLKEAKNEHGEQEYTTYAAWKRALKKNFPESWIEGDEDIAQGFLGPKPFKRGQTKGVGEWGGDTGYLQKVKVEEGKQADSMGKHYGDSVNAMKVKAHNAVIKKDGRFTKNPHKLGKAPRGYQFDDKGLLVLKEDYLEEAKQKRGSFIQKLFETVLVELGLPQALITTTGPATVGTGIYRTSELIEQDSNLERALRLLATRLGVKQTDAVEPVQEEKGIYISRHLAKVEEAVDVGNDDFAQAVVALVAALGIPDDVLERRRTQIVQALRQKKTTIKNRAQVLTLMGRLSDLLSKSVTPGQQGEADQE